MTNLNGTWIIILDITFNLFSKVVNHTTVFNQMGVELTFFCTNIKVSI